MNISQIKFHIALAFAYMEGIPAISSLVENSMQIIPDQKDSESDLIETRLKNYILHRLVLNSTNTTVNPLIAIYGINILYFVLEIQSTKIYKNQHAFKHCIEEIFQFVLDFDNYFGINTRYICIIENSKAHFRNLKEDLALLIEKVLDLEDYDTICNIYKIPISLISKEYENNNNFWNTASLDENTVEIIDIILSLFEYILIKFII